MFKKNKKNIEPAVQENEWDSKQQNGKRAAKEKAKPEKEKKKNEKKIKIPKTVQDSIPYLAVYQNGIFEIEPGLFSRSYKLEDVNFKIATQEEQENIFERYNELLNSFDSSVKIQITINNRNIDEQQFCKDTLLSMKKDGLDEYREEYNEMLLAKMKEGRNNLRKEKYITLTIEAEDIDMATQQFFRYDLELSSQIKKITGSDTQPMTTEERLSVLHDIYNIDEPYTLTRTEIVDGEEVKVFDLKTNALRGMSTKDVIAPNGMEFSKNYAVIGDTYTRSFFIDNLPTIMNANFLSEITEINNNLLISVNFEPIRPDKAVKMVRNQITNINSNVVDAQKRAVKGNYGADLISPELKSASKEAEDLLHDLQERNQKLFLVTITMTLFAENLDELTRANTTLQTMVGKHLCQLKVLNYQQESGFNTTLPLGNCKIYTDRLLTTESAGIFIPFSTQELNSKHGMYYGLNAVSRNMIFYDRKAGNNYNGIVLGTPGSGKSFSSKREMIDVILNTDDDVYIIDPEREYVALAELLGGQIVKIAPGSKSYINPLDLDIDDNSDDGDAITLKSDFIISLCDAIVGGREGLSQSYKSIIDRCIKKIYLGYENYLKEFGNGKTKDPEHCPTLADFYNELLVQPEIEAKKLALELEIYCTGSLDTFAHKTNVNTSGRLVVYDIKDIGSGMKEMGLQICCNDAWNRIITNFKRGKSTWLYIDEFHILAQNESSAKFIKQIYKRARKWNGIPTGMTQNVEDLLASAEMRAVINNCAFVMMLNQSPIDREQLSDMLNISPTQMSYVTNSDPGQGLIYTGKAIIPFVDKFPKNTKLYRVMTTKPDERMKRA